VHVQNRRGQQAIFLVKGSICPCYISALPQGSAYINISEKRQSCPNLISGKWSERFVKLEDFKNDEKYILNYLRKL
jgi:hypothetical protein